MSEQSPYQMLGVSEDASFDEIQSARDRLVQIRSSDPAGTASPDQPRVEDIEAAYDAILMERLRMRQAGQIQVPDQIRFAEKKQQEASKSNPKPFTLLPIEGSPAWLQNLLDTPSRADILWPGGIALALAGMVILLPSGGTLQFALAITLLTSIYFLNRKEKKFGRSLLFTIVGLLFGLIVGAVLGNWLQPPLSQVGLSVDAFATLLTLFLLWVITSFLR